MDKLQKLHLEPIKKYKEVLAASKSAEITKDVAIKFGNFLGQKCFWVNNAYYSYQNKTYTTEQLFEEFLKQYNGTIK